MSRGSVPLVHAFKPSGLPTKRINCRGAIVRNGKWAELDKWCIIPKTLPVLVLPAWRQAGESCGGGRKAVRGILTAEVCY